MPSMLKEVANKNNNNNKTTAKILPDMTDNDKTSLAIRRPRRQPKAHPAFKDEDDAQLELAIKLSLLAQKTRKKVKHKNLEPLEQNSSEEKPTEKKELLTPKPAAPTNTSSSFEPEKHSKKHASSTALHRTSPSKKKKIECAAPRIDLSLKRGKIPTTASFISYVLQKGSSNRDMDLVRQFERDEPPKTITPVASNSADSESDCENV
ncbi:uncharacterized protein DDB_G0280579-like [Watersipora subatra]|uniref:uncharacterized protein DDB_G0280579-like n=1 Tax=Watersipora subatra TaxID=2589382 RepID=UPI00355ADF70